MSTPPKPLPLAPRIVILAGVAAMFGSNFLREDPTVHAMSQLAGGAVALAGLVWLLLAMRAARR